MPAPWVLLPTMAGFYQAPNYQVSLTDIPSDLIGGPLMIPVITPRLLFCFCSIKDSRVSLHHSPTMNMETLVTPTMLITLRHALLGLGPPRATGNRCMPLVYFHLADTPNQRR